MYIPKILFLSLFQFLLLLHHLLTPAAVDSPLRQICGNTGNYTANSTYQSNLNLILSSLVANASGPGAGFSDNITGQTPDQISGLVLCRGDVNPSDCGSCLRRGASDILNICPYDEDAVICHATIRRDNPRLPIAPANATPPNEKLGNTGHCPGDGYCSYSSTQVLYFTPEGSSQIAPQFRARWSKKI